MLVRDQNASTTHVCVGFAAAGLFLTAGLLLMVGRGISSSDGALTPNAAMAGYGASWCKRIVGMVFVPSHRRRCRCSSATLTRYSSHSAACEAQSWLEGQPGGSGAVYVDVRDVARAHVLAAEVPQAEGRYTLSHTHGSDVTEIAAWLQVPRPTDLPIAALAALKRCGVCHRADRGELPGAWVACRLAAAVYVLRFVRM